MAQLTLLAQPGDLAEMMLQSVCDHLRRFADLAAPAHIAPPDLTYIKELTRSAVEAVDGPRGWLGRCLLTQEWQVSCDFFLPEMVLPIAPVRSITEIRYVDDAGATTTLDANIYRLHGAGSWSAQISPRFGSEWPASRHERDSITISISAGYGDSIDDVPAPVLHGIRMLVAHWYLERQPVTFSTPHEIPLTIKSAFAPYRIYR